MKTNIRRRLALMSVLVAGVGAMAACLSINDPDLGPVTRYGAIAVKSRNGPAASGIGSVVAIFFDAQNAGIPESRRQPDRCDFAALDTTTSELRGVLMAGASLGLKVGTQNVTLPYEPLFKRYGSGATAYTYHIDDSIQVTIPGQNDGYPASAINVKLAQPIIPGAVAVPAAGQPFNVTWNAVIDTTSAIVVSLRYASPATSTYPNQQIICALIDDGAFSIPETALASFLASPAAMRSLVMTRWRTRITNINPTTYLHVVSSIDTTVTFP